MLFHKIQLLIIGKRRGLVLAGHMIIKYGALFTSSADIQVCQPLRICGDRGNNTLLGLRVFKKSKYGFQVLAQHGGVLAYMTRLQKFKKSVERDSLAIRTKK